MRKLCQVAGLVIIRLVISTSSPPVVGSCKWLIRAVHSQFVVLSSSLREVLCCISTSSKTLTLTVYLHSSTEPGFHIYWKKKETVCIRAQVCRWVFIRGAAECKYAYLAHDRPCAIIRRLALTVVTSDKGDWYRCGVGGSWPWRFCGGRHTGADSWSHVTRLHNEPEANAGVGQRCDLCGEDGEGFTWRAWWCRSASGRPGTVGGWNFFGRFRVLGLHLVKQSTFPQSDSPPSPPPERGVERCTITSLPGRLKDDASTAGISTWEILESSEFSS